MYGYPKKIKQLNHSIANIIVFQHYKLAPAKTPYCHDMHCEKIIKIKDIVTCKSDSVLSKRYLWLLSTNSHNEYVHMYVCMYVCMHACMHTCMHACMYV